MDHLRGKWSIDVPRTVRVCGLAILAALLLLSCEPPSYTTIEWQTDVDGFVQYSTNDKQYLETIHYLPVVNEDPMTTVTATVKKVSGSSVVGFGIVFCYQDENNHYRLLITTDGHYEVGEMFDGTYTAKVPWDTSPDLATGFGATNEISIIRDAGTFTVKFNTVTNTTFTDSSFPGGLAGPCIGIGSSSNENFPTVPEDGRFKMTAPGVYPP